MEKICVAVRLRPPLPQEGLNPSAALANWRIDENRVSLHSPLGTPISGVSFAFGKLLLSVVRASFLFSAFPCYRAKALSGVLGLTVQIMCSMRLART